MFTVTHRLPMGVVLFTVTELASANSLQSLEHENVFGFRPLTWIIFAALFAATVWLWQSTKDHQPLHREKTRTDPTVGWAFIGILAIGFVLGVLFQLLIGVHIISFSSRWLDVDGQTLAIVFGCLSFIGGGKLTTYLLRNLPWFSSWIGTRRKVHTSPTP